MLREDWADFLVEVDGEESRGGQGEQAGEGKAEHGVGPSGVSVLI
ncbi:MAG: hypothetical protein RI910_2075 [Verrucomicrobiota bacterium]